MKKQEDSDHFLKVTECYYSRILGTSDNLFAHNYLKPFSFILLFVMLPCKDTSTASIFLQFRQNKGL